MKSKLVIKVWSDNYDGVLFDFEAYKELRLQMSTGDFHTHRTEFVNVLEDTKVIDLYELTEEVPV